MSLLKLPPNARIEKIEWAILQGERPRSAGSNARIGVHGKTVSERMARVTIDGVSGFGWSLLTKEEAEPLIGKTVSEIFHPENGFIQPQFRSIEFALLDWAGQILQKPVYELISRQAISGPVAVPCYDTSLYFDDLLLDNDAEAVKLLQSEAAEGWDKGHRNFKIKIGRGGRYMPNVEGMRRDIAIVRGIREYTGPDSRIMVDANNGYNLNLTKEFLLGVEDTKLYWLEEAFHEDDQLYADLREWMKQREMHVLISDGEGLAAPPIVDWAEKGLIDIIQYDIRFYGFTNWLELGIRLDKSKIKSAPHNYGSGYGGYASGHLALALDGFQFVEWDTIVVEGIDASGYSISDGMLHVPSKAGFGLDLDGSYFSRMVTENGWRL
ncbi:mandelate racemase [Paenibacillus sp. S3N08]|uniref:Mandelate racemase n=2 Tax=Paenibacillus agricola TaxID=2716264 RepID=A0ABX0JEM9_9BACL|nr:mandelate racemase [Paenibacillus agricola]